MNKRILIIPTITVVLSATILHANQVESSPAHETEKDLQNDLISGVVSRMEEEGRLGVLSNEALTRAEDLVGLFFLILRTFKPIEKTISY